MTDNNDISFDEKSGISLEEQKEIFEQINGIAEKQRRQLSRPGDENSGGKNAVNAKKNSSIFPLAVNAAAVIMLVSGAVLLVSFNGRTDAQVRKGDAFFNPTERALIDEIRKDTAEAIAAKEREIESIASRLGNVDNELLQLYSSNQELTADQRAAQERLIAQQNAFREELSVLQDERSQILESSRSREARLRAVLDERTREFAAAQTQTASELDSAMRELERLTSEREKIEAIEALFAGGIAVVNEQGQSSQINQADQFELMARNTQLENDIAEMQKTIDALGSGGSGLTRRIGELEDALASLRTANTSLEHGSAERESAIALLETENQRMSADITQLRNESSAKDQSIVQLRNESNAKDQRIADLNTQLTAIRQLLQDN
ncbi:MAG: hypothetical protein FWD40_05015 [Treponema sp.]|nr:hypothetical protein [Treponema sp.]